MLWLASLIVAYSIHGDRLDATVTGELPTDDVMLHDLTHERHIAALSVKPAAAGQMVATFDLDVLEGDGKQHELALEWHGAELGRGKVVLPAMPDSSWLSYLVILGPLMGLGLIIAAILIGRKTLKKAMASEPRRRPFQLSPDRNSDPPSRPS